MNRKEKIRSFAKEHKKALILAGLMVLSGTAGYRYGKKSVYKNEMIVESKIVKDVIGHASSIYDNRVAVFGTNESPGLKPEDLGAMGERMIELGAKDVTFTHFIAIGPRVET